MREGLGAVSANNRDAEGDIVQASRWAARWRELELEALDVARAMTDPAAKRYMLFISESYRLLAERAESRRDRLTALVKASLSSANEGLGDVADGPDTAQ
jgi:hypothetical protein